MSHLQGIVSAESLLTPMNPNGDENLNDSMLLIVSIIESYINWNSLRAEWKLAEHQSAGEALIEYRLGSPFDKRHTDESDSFALSLMPDNSIVFSDGNLNFSGDLIDLLHSIQSKGYEKANKVSPQKVADKFLDAMKLPLIKLLRSSETKLDSENEENTGDLFPEWVWQNMESTWGTFHTPSCMIEYYSQHDVIYSEETKEFFLRKNEIYEVLKKDAFKKKVINYFEDNTRIMCNERILTGHRISTTQFKSEIGLHASVPPSSVTEDRFEENRANRYLPLSNGVYDVKEKILIDYRDIDIKNLYKLPFEYKPSTGEGIALFKDLYSQILEKPESLEDLITFISAYVQGLGYPIGSISLVGQPNSGKSHLTNLIAFMMGSSKGARKDTENSKRIEGESPVGFSSLGRFFGSEMSAARFTQTALMRKRLFIFTECNDKPRGDMSQLKDYQKDPDLESLVYGEYKNGENIVFPFYGNLIFNSQQYLKFPYEDGGHTRRYTPWKFKHITKDELDLSDLFESLRASNSDSFEIINDLFCWLIEKDVEAKVALMKDDWEPQWLNENRSEVAAQNNPAYQFAKEMITIDLNLTEPSLSMSYVYDTFKQWHSPLKMGRNKFCPEFIKAVCHLTGKKESEVLHEQFKNAAKFVRFCRIE